jgi:uncharacterized protein (TIGR03089 family)
MTVIDAFLHAVAARPQQPLITFYDDATGERAELSGATLANWVAKTANLLVDGLGLAPGDLAYVRLPPHWQTAGLLLGCWTAGLTVTSDGRQTAAVAFVAEPVEPLPAADEIYALALAPFGMPFRGAPPPGTEDFIAHLRGHGDRMPPVATRPDQVAIAGRTHASLATPVPELPARLLIDTQAYPDPVDWLVRPLLAGSSTVLCRHTDPARVPERLDTERATRYPPAD